MHVITARANDDGPAAFLDSRFYRGLECAVVVSNEVSFGLADGDDRFVAHFIYSLLRNASGLFRKERVRVTCSTSSY